MIPPHFNATVYFLTEQEGGRKTPVMSGYRPKIQFGTTSVPVQGILNFPDVENAFPGDRVKAEITLPGHDSPTDHLYAGMDFDFFEGETPTGRGLITSVPENQKHRQDV